MFALRRPPKIVGALLSLFILYALFWALIWRNPYRAQMLELTKDCKFTR